MKIITTPWKKEFYKLIDNSNKSIKITSPFLKENICNDILRIKSTNVKLELVTSFKLTNLLFGSLDIIGIENILKHNGIVKNFAKLHSKIYLFDERKVIITSANLTNGGLLNNYEYGIYTEEKNIVKQVMNDFEKLFSNVNTGLVKLEDINTVKNILASIPEAEKKKLKLPEYKIETPEENFDSVSIPITPIKDNLKGWKLEVFNLLDTFEKQIFSLKELTIFENDLKIKYPNNNNILAKIRQQLQFLRDLGLIEFLGNGKYRKLWN